VADTDNIDQDQDTVHLMTLHSAKGLEFPIVFIAGLEEGILPHSRSMLNADEMEEERRLMYVGVTRAKEKVCLLHAEMRVIFGSTQANPPSRFLDDIPSHLIVENHKSEITNSLATPDLAKPDNFQTNSKSQTPNPKQEIQSPNNSEIQNKNSQDTKCMPHDTDFKDGQKVRHPDFGEGVVISTQDDIITIAFMKTGIKKLSLSFAPLEKV